MSRPVRTNVIVLRYPPSVFLPTFSVGGGGLPRTPDTATRSGPASASAMVSKCATTSGPRYPGGPSSYNSCAVTVCTVTAPPVPGCLVTTHEPSAATSAMGKPGWCTSASSVKKAKLPPVACAPHSRMWPATVAPASAS